MSKNKTSKLAPSTSFRDTDRLYQIMDRIGLDRGLADSTLETFTEDLNELYEISINNTKSIGIMLLGEGLAFYQRATAFMEQVGIAAEEIEFLLNCGEAFEYHSMLFKIDLSDQGVGEISYYHKKKLTLEELTIWLTSSRIDAVEQEKVITIARFLDMVHAGVGVSVKPGQAGIEKIYFNKIGHITSWHKIAAAVKSVLKIEDTAILDLFQNYFTTNKNGLYFAVAFLEQKLVPVAQLVVSAVDSQVAKELFKQKEYSQQTVDTIDYAMQTSPRPYIDYLSFKLTGNGIKAIKSYFYNENFDDSIIP